MKKWHFFAFIFICLLLQLTFLHGLSLWGVRPNLILIILIISCLKLDLKWAVALGIYSGFMQELFTINALPVDIFLYPAVSLLVVKLSRKITLENNLLRLILVLVVVLTVSAIRLAMNTSGQIIPMGVMFRTILLEMALSLIVTPLVIKVIYGSR